MKISRTIETSNQKSIYRIPIVFDVRADNKEEAQKQVQEWLNRVYEKDLDIELPEGFSDVEKLTHIMSCKIFGGK